VKITLIEHNYHPTAKFHRSLTNLLMHLQWYIRLVTIISKQLWTILSILF